ncbi:MAG: hypothetical protein AAFQ98_12045 [Bacteroidota bacterium]
MPKLTLSTHALGKAYRLSALRFEIAQGAAQAIATQPSPMSTPGEEELLIKVSFYHQFMKRLAKQFNNEIAAKYLELISRGMRSVNLVEGLIKAIEQGIQQGDLGPLQKLVAAVHGSTNDMDQDAQGLVAALETIAEDSLPEKNQFLATLKEVIAHANTSIFSLNQELESLSQKLPADLDAIVEEANVLAEGIEGLGQGAVGGAGAIGAGKKPPKGKPGGQGTGGNSADDILEALDLASFVLPAIQQISSGLDGSISATNQYKSHLDQLVSISHTLAKERTDLAIAKTIEIQTTLFFEIVTNFLTNARALQSGWYAVENDLAQLEKEIGKLDSQGQSALQNTLDSAKHEWAALETTLKVAKRNILS